MRLGIRILDAVAVALAVGVGAFLVTVVLVVWTDPCDRRVAMCDLAPIAGIGLGFVVGPLVGLVAGGIVFRRGRRRRDASASRDA